MRLLGPALGHHLDRRTVELGLACLVGLHAGQLALGLAGVAWSRTRVVVLVLACSLLWLLLRRLLSRYGPDPPPAGEPSAAPSAAPSADPAADPGGPRLSWGDLLAALAWAIYAAFAATRRIVTPDFVYTWGVKGEHYFLARGVDWSYLTGPAALTITPDYPNLLPNLFAAVALVLGRFSERAMALVSAGLFALLLLALREALRRAGAMPPAARQGALAAAALGTAMFGIGYRMAGGADWLIALAAAAALAPLLRPGGPRDELRVGLAAALAAGSKLEGMPFAALLVLAYLGRDRRRLAGELRERRLARLAVRIVLLTAPALAVVVPYLLEGRRHGALIGTHLGGGGPAGALRPEILRELVRSLGDAVVTPEWAGLGWLLPLLLPALLAVRRTRLFGLVLTAQIAAELAVFLSSPSDLRIHVLTSAPRLVFQLWPAALTAGMVALAGDRRPEATADGDRPPHSGAARSAGWRIALLAGLLLWTVVGFGQRVVAARSAFRPAPGPWAASDWRLGEAAADDLRRYLRQMEPYMYPNDVVVLSTGYEGGPLSRQGRELTLWASYFLPRHRVIPIDRPGALHVGDYLLTYPGPPPVEESVLRRIARRQSGSLYWIPPETRSHPPPLPFAAE